MSDQRAAATHDQATNERAGQTSVTRPVALVLTLATLLATTAIALLASGGSAMTAAQQSSWWWVALIVIGFALADRFAFHVEFRRQAISFTLSEIPTIFALIYLGPVVAVTARVAAGVAMLYVRGRPLLYKSFFNVAIFAFEVALAFTVFSAWIDATDSSELMIIVGAILGVVVSSTAGSALVLVAIACFEGSLLPRIRAELPVASAIAGMGALVGATAAAPTFVRSSFIVLSALPIMAVWLTMSRHARLAQSHRDLAAVHEFAAAIRSSLVIDELADIALRQLSDQFRTDDATIVLGDPDSPNGRSWATRARPDHDATDETAGDDDSAPRVLTAPLRHGADAMGHVVIHGRNGVTNVFGADDAQRLEAFATQLAGALTNALAHAQMEHDASHDVLTGDFNRAAFDRHVKERLGAHPRCAATLMIDLDNFKEVNDTLGHHVGDEVLREFSRRVHALLDDEDVFARFGGDEFAAYIERKDEQEIRAVADAILSASYSAICLDGLDVVVTSSVGIAMVDHDLDAGSLLRRADIAMYSAKRQRAGFETYSEDIDRRTPERLSLLGDLRRALEEASLEVHFQPKIALASNTVTGAEALVRWNHPTRGWVRPDEFIPLAEESGLIRLLTDQVVSASIEQAS
ncbi:MAG: diguanylate cyclase, partial [Ilumatobacter sp.]